jgi:hypothetical protein
MLTCEFRFSISFESKSNAENYVEYTLLLLSFKLLELLLIILFDFLSNNLCVYYWDEEEVDAPKFDLEMGVEGFSWELNFSSLYFLFYKSS